MKIIENSSIPYHLKLISANLMVHFWKNTEKIIFNPSKKRKDKKKNIS